MEPDSVKKVMWLMQVEIKIDESCQQPKIVIFTSEMTEEVAVLIQKLADLH